MTSLWGNLTSDIAHGWRSYRHHRLNATIPCKTIGLALDGGGVVVSSAGLATVWIPGVGETLLLVGSGVDLGGLAFDMAHEEGDC